MAGLKVVSVKVLANGGLDLKDLKAKAEQYKDNLAAFMVCLFSGLSRMNINNYRTDHIPFDVRCL